MHHRPKLVPPLLLASLMLLLVPHLHSYPAINQPSPQQNNYEQNLNKVFFPPRELEDTIHEVQKILAQDPTLPRLTRGEIEELYEKVTREEYQKSIEAGDLGRADSMRALMLVLPYNTDNNTEENLQELFTRPPVTKVIDAYTPPQPIKFVTADPSSPPKAEYAPIGNLAATTYKPTFPLKMAQLAPNPTTYHPQPPPVMYKMTPSLPSSIREFQPVTNLPLAPEKYGVQNAKPVQRFSSHYNAKNAEFLKLPAQRKPSANTVRPVADVLESLGIVGKTQSRTRYGIEDYYAAESAPKPVISAYVPQTVSVAELQELRSQSLSPKIGAEAYVSFKPLNIGEEIRAKPEVEGYLTRFGIVGGRKRKELKKGDSKAQGSEEQASEISAAQLPGGGKSVSNIELEKLLENLQELERLNGNAKTRTTTTPRPTTTTTKRTTTTTTTTTPAPVTPSLITNGAPLLIEPKKPRRRIDPNIDINYGASSNKHTEQTNADQLSKLLENLQELEKLKINPENVLKAASPTLKASTKPLITSTTTTTTTTPAPVIRAQTITNRFSELALPTSQTNDAQQLQRVLKELQAYEQANLRSTTRPTTRRPARLRDSFGPTDIFQLQKLLSDDGELERLYEQARAKQAPRTTTTTTTTRRPTPSLSDIEQLQKYFAQLESSRPAPTTTSTTTSTTTTTTTTTTTPKPTTTPTQPPTTPDYSQRTKKPSIDSDQLEELINRVQQLERLNGRKTDATRVPTTETTIPFLGFTSRNVKSPKASSNDYRVPTNDFAHLQELYKQVQEAEQASYGHIEISTAATASKTGGKRVQDFAQRIIDITNDTGSGSSLQEVDPNDFVQLQKLLSKVQELERVKIDPAGGVQTATPHPALKPQRDPTNAPNLVTSASVQTSSVQSLNGAQIVYPMKQAGIKSFEEIFLKDSMPDDLKLELPAYESTTQHSHVSKKGNALLDPTSSEELRELAYSAPANPKNTKLDKEFEQYQQFFTQLEDDERNSYKNMQPPMIYKTATKEPPRFIATHKPQAVDKKKLMNNEQADLQELQKLLNNAQELEKLGVTLPTDLSQQIETKLTKNVNMEEGMKKLKTYLPTEGPEVEEYLNRYNIAGARVHKSRSSTTTTKPDSAQNESSEKTAVFSLTTMRSAMPKEPKPTTESVQDLPIFSATKIIEAAIKRAANKIGVSTEQPQPQGFRRRSDDDIIAEEYDDMVGEFSEMNYQLAIPEINEMAGVVVAEKQVAPKPEANAEDHSKDLTELQRLISNLQELQKLNISVNSNVLRQADKQYLESFKKSTADDDSTKKNRRQSATPALATATVAESSATTASATTIASTTSNADSTESSTTTTTESSVTESTTAAPTRISLDLGLDDQDDSDVAASDKESTSTEGSTSSTTEESRNGSLADLEDSFGPDPNKQEELPAKKKNGFYFLADWNSFLEVGDGDDQVVVRLSPKIGDPRLFLPVKIP